MCPYRFLHSIFDIYRGNGAGTSTYVPLGPAKGGDVFCRICGRMDHSAAICRHKHLVREFIGTPPPTVTIAKDESPKPCSPKPCLLSSDYLVVPDIFDHVGREKEREASGGGLEQVEFFNSLGEMVYFIREANKKSTQTGKSMAERPIVVGGAFNQRLHHLEYCIMCCKYTNHPGFLCPYNQFVPTGETVGPGCVLVCCLCGTEDCHMHQQRRAAPMTCSYCGAFYDHLTRDCPHTAAGAMYLPCPPPW